MASINNLRSLEAKIKALADRYGSKNPVVVVGFTQSYAVHVHENTQAHHQVGQAKFLEQPARQLQKQLGTIVEQVTSKSKDLEKGLLTAGMRLQREAQLLTPVDTSALKASAFTDLEENLEAASSKAYRYSEAIKAGKQAYRMRKHQEMIAAVKAKAWKAAKRKRGKA
ncbi:hypothetical protein M0R72_07335 [Candidatus Pacearchaeota archaeon]|jgi:hypothetical protein|nr:hypothetical protein [Candidatus Pacearchaeota archaeon]